ncbi:Rax1p [Kluyveromyces lactis]|uniref:KLLA0F24904p n=1 Tax=Kluyveromyces lactis (strain ATCC 8585 / CBS 2359 / DSM 70799 / NBRC 1267 / NRRL Y-1140 / WM37) TaxID=284590 RepID=Q6CIQ0_KLULA|nr:uncharacterized protein KLLA0_F24904g [Kluyveromyces lactis]CAG98897.1 KLLA0F24904p [Kluyveromyces lactis]|eukprot:XP_456189.1 uncharacterized protein KLLA0_F24904g [Kluyveromyces lactis]
MEKLPNSQRARLPTLYEVLNQQTAAPLDLWSFYTYLSQYPHAIVYLDFWTDVMAYLRLCKDYVKGIRESVLDVNKLETPTVLQEGNGDDKRESVSSAMLLEALMNDGYLDYNDSQRVSQFLKGETDSPRLSQLLQDWKQVNNDQIDFSDFVDGLVKSNVTKDHKPKLTTKQLISSAQDIVSTYLLSQEQSDRFLFEIPAYLRNDTIRLIMEEKRHDPEVFEPIKEIVYQFLEVDCFPRFLGCVALHNLHDEIVLQRPKKNKSYNSRSNSPFSQWSTASRLTIGLAWWLVGLWIGYTLIFMNYSKGIRVVCIVPFFLGSYYIICGIYLVDIIYAFSGVTQTLVSKRKLDDLELRSMNNHRSNSLHSSNEVPWWLTIFGGRSRLCKVKHPFVNSIMIRRALWCLLLVLIMTAILTAIFAAVPGRRI